MMMSAMVRVLVALACLNIVSGQRRSLKNRLDQLYLQVNRESVHFREDLLEIRDIITGLNASCVTSSDANTNADNQKSSPGTVNIEELLQRVETEQETRFRKLQKGLSDEKRLSREIRRKQEILISKNPASLEIMNAALKELNDRVRRLELDSNATHTEMIEDVDAVKDELADVKDEIDTAKQAATDRKPECPSGWQSWNTSCYLLLMTPLSWDNARANCTLFGGQLAQGETSEEMTYLLTFVGNNVWLGGHDSDTEGTWMWADGGQEIAYLPWESGQPNSSGGEQDCLEAYESLLNDEGCDVKNKVLCEKQVM